MKVWSDSFDDGARLAERLAFGAHDPEIHCRLVDNKNPHLGWSGAPEGTASFAIICHDPDVPSVGDDVNQEGKSVPHDLPRVDFFHWVVADIPVTCEAVAEGAYSDGITAKGKSATDPSPGRAGINSYTQWFAGDADMGGQYFGYDGPCPPWNDERLHHYVFTVFALDVASLDLTDAFDGPAARAAMEKHVLDSASITGTYAINPAV